MLNRVPEECPSRPLSPAQQCLYELELDEEPQFCSANEANRVLDPEGNLIRKEMGEGRGYKAGHKCVWKPKLRKGER